jgi:hypothetical protein
MQRRTPKWAIAHRQSRTELDKLRMNANDLWEIMKELRKLSTDSRLTDLEPHQGGSIEYPQNALVAEQPAAQNC